MRTLKDSFRNLLEHITYQQVADDVLRFFFPKGYNFHSLDNETLQNIVLSINLRPKKCLNRRSPFEVFFGVALA